MMLKNSVLETRNWKDVVKVFRAFTLVETLVAISILLLALVGPMSIAARALSSAYYARDEVTAFYLAQEGVEYIRAVRDQNYLKGNADWLTCLNGTTDSSCPSAPSCIGVSCVVDVPNFSHTACSGTCPKLSVTTGGGLYNQSSGQESPFTRTVTIVPVNADEVSVKVTISWMSGRIPRNFQLTNNLLHAR